MSRGCCVMLLLLVLVGCQGPMSGSSLFAPAESARVPAPKTGRFKPSNSYYPRQKKGRVIERTGPQEAANPSARTARSNPKSGVLKWLPARNSTDNSLRQLNFEGDQPARSAIDNDLNRQGMPVNDATRLFNPPENATPLKRKSSSEVGTGVPTARRGRVEVVDFSNFKVRPTSGQAPLTDNNPTPVTTSQSGGWKKRD